MSTFYSWKENESLLANLIMISCSIFHLVNVLRSFDSEQSTTYLSNFRFMKFLIGPKKFCHNENKAETNKTYDHAAKIFLGLSL